MTFWQGIVISLLAESTDILGRGGEAVKNSESDDEETYAKQAQNFLICLEMLGFSIAHFYCFPVEEWEDGYRPTEDQSKFGDKLALGDFLHDLKLIMRHKSKKKKDQMGSRSNSVGSFSTVPEEDEEVGSLLDKVEGLLLEEESCSAGKDSTSSSIVYKSNVNDSSSDGEQRVNTLKAKPDGKVDELPFELRQARALLLESRLLDETTASLLTTDMLHQLSNGQQKEKQDTGQVGDTRMIDDGHQKADTDDEESLTAAELLDEKSNEGENSNATDSTRLSAASRNDQMLQPSIFTMHS